MASQKKSPAQKITAAVANLLKTSKERAEIGTALPILEATFPKMEDGEDSDPVRILKNAKLRYDADVEYLRKNIVYNCGKLTEEMSDQKFDNFAKGLLSLI